VCGEKGRPGCTAVWRTARSTVDLDRQCQPGFLPMPQFDWTGEREKEIFLSLYQQRNTRAPLPLRCPMMKTARRKKEKTVFCLLYVSKFLIKALGLPTPGGQRCGGRVGCKTLVAAPAGRGHSTAGRARRAVVQRAAVWEENHRAGGPGGMGASVKGCPPGGAPAGRGTSGDGHPPERSPAQRRAAGRGCPLARNPARSEAHQRDMPARELRWRESPAGRGAGGQDVPAGRGAGHREEQQEDRRRGGPSDGRGAGRDARRRRCAPAGICASRNDIQSKERPARRDCSREGHYRRGTLTGRYASAELHHRRAAPARSRASVEGRQRGGALAGRDDVGQTLHQGGTHRGSSSWPERRHRAATTSLAPAASCGINRACSY